MPGYYLTIEPQGSGAAAVVHASAGGARTGSVSLPVVPGGFGSASVTAAANDRSFIIGTVSAAGHRTAYRLYRLPVSASGTPGALTAVTGVSIPLSGAPMSRATVAGIALSPDGTKVAITIERFAPSVDTFAPAPELDVVDLRTGQLRSWTMGPGTALAWAGPPSWANGNSVVGFTWWRVTSTVFPHVAQRLAGVGQLNTADPHATLPGTLIQPRVPGLTSVVFASASPVAIGAACQNEPVGGGGRGVVIARFGQVLPAGEFHVLSTRTASYDDVQTRLRLMAQCAVLSVDPTGQHALVLGFGLGRVDHGSFTMLPGVPAGAAW